MFIGIDVSKEPPRRARPVVTPGLRHGARRRRPGTARRRVLRLAPELVGPEATGGFENTVAAALAAVGLLLAVVNPAQIRAVARAGGGWPRPTASTPPSSPASLKPSAPSPVRSPPSRPGAWPNSSAGAAKSSR